MGVRAGDIRQVKINSREFDPKGEDGNVNIDVGGFTNTYALNGNGTGHITQRRKAAGFSDLPLSLDDARKDLEFLQKIADDGDPVPVVMVLASGKTYSGSLVLVGDLGKATGDGIATVEMRGQKFEQI
jgi:hypothetical protein